MSIRKSTDVDLAEVRHWLKAEHERDREGFWNNMNIIEGAHAKGCLFVLPDEMTDLPIGFIANGEDGPDILSVRTDRRGKGAGRRLAQHMVQRFMDQDEVCVIELQCAPETSIPFWRKMGFTHYRGQGEDRAYRIVEKTWPVDPAAPAIEARIGFFPESVKWKPDTEPLLVATTKAARESEISIGLANRVVFHTGRRSGMNDTVVSIMVNGIELYRDKAKYQQARDLGVIADSYAYYLDEVVVTDEEIASARAVTA